MLYGTKNAELALLSYSAISRWAEMLAVVFIRILNIFVPSRGDLVLVRLQIPPLEVLHLIGPRQAGNS